MRKIVIIILALISAAASAQKNKEVQGGINTFLKGYYNPRYSNQEKYKVEEIIQKPDSQKLEIKLNETFLGQPFDKETVERVYRELTANLPRTYSEWEKRITVNGNELSELIPSYKRKPAERRTWEGIDYKGEPWVKNLSRPWVSTKGLEGRHIALWASHGRYFKQATGEWVWQRPQMNATLEDLYTSTIVIPYLMPMLERSGAVLFSPRERSWQKNEVVVTDAELFQGHKNSIVCYIWDAKVPEDGEYPVYVRYQNIGDNAADAEYVVVHEGIETRVAVNQQMGAGIWTYLGSWHFKAGDTQHNCVKLILKNYKGRISVDAVRFGGGMGQSGLGRAWEGARYSTIYYGFPEEVYLTKEGKDDYGEDINCRSLASNHLARGSVFVPKDSVEKFTLAENGTDTLVKWKEERDGLHVPLELSLAVHSDAGNRKGDEIVGSLAVYTKGFMDGVLPAGPSRLVNRDFADLMLDKFSGEMTTHFGRWTRRQLYDRNYSESRIPRVPSMILETLSHQNFTDMTYGNDPYCEFFMARGIYKAVLQYIHEMHGNEDYMVQPMPVEDLSAQVNPADGTIHLKWTKNRKEDSHVEGYILYTSIGNNGWNNGEIIKGNSTTIKPHPGALYRFKVTAFNKGGESLDSPSLAARLSENKNARNLLIVDAFNRIASPQVINDGTTRGFLPAEDPGVPYHSKPCASGILQKGNTFDWSVRYAEDLQRGGDHNISSTTQSAIHSVSCHGEDAILVVCGAQRRDGYSHREYESLSPTLKDALKSYAENGGNIMVTGAYVGEDNNKEFLREIMHCDYLTAMMTDTLSVRGMGLQFTLPDGNESERHYSVARVNALMSLDGAFVSMLYEQGETGCAVAYQGKKYRAMTYGFPIELIEEREKRAAILDATVRFLTER